MDHIVYVDAKFKAKDLEEIISGKRTMIIRGAAGRKLPYGRVHKGDVLYLVRNNGEGLAKGKCKVKSVINSDKLTKEESIRFVENYLTKLHLSEKQFQKWAGKRYIVLIEIEEVNEVEPFKFDRSSYSNMDDWLPVEEIATVRIK